MAEPRPRRRPLIPRWLWVADAVALVLGVAGHLVYLAGAPPGERTLCPLLTSLAIFLVISLGVVLLVAGVERLRRR